jgi:hypothetical protein
VTKDEHRLRLTAFENEAKIFTRSFQMLGAAGLVIFPFAGAFWASSLGVSPPIFIGAFFGSFWCGYLLWAWMIKHLIAQFGLTCPLCTKHLTGPFGEFALMTGECLKCGSPIFDGDEPKPREAGALLKQGGISSATKGDDPGLPRARSRIYRTTLPDLRVRFDPATI